MTIAENLSFFQNTNTNNLGIGCCNLTASTGLNNVALGYNALCNNATGCNNLAIGFCALRANLGGSNNTAIGFCALSGNVTGCSNIVIGNFAGRLITGGSGNFIAGDGAGIGSTTFGFTGGCNTLIGCNAGSQLATGSCNFFAGYWAGYASTSSNENIGLGSFALGPNQGQHNIAIGGLSMALSTSGINNIAIGCSALCVNTLGNDNVAMGFLALCSNTTGCNNIAIGCSALRLNSSGFNNIAIGAFALQNTTIPCNSTAIGYGALRNQTTGGDNIAIGGCANCGNTTGCNNIAIGNGALGSNTSGIYNTAVGNLALRGHTTGFGNTAIGYCSLYSNTSGSSNIAIGTSTLKANTIGINNIAIGGQSLQANISGVSNIAIGTGALCVNTCGNCNIAIGMNALCLSSTGCGGIALGMGALAGNTSGLNNTAIGNCAGCLITTGCNNVLLGSYSGTAIPTLTCNVIISDGAGTVKMNFTSTGALSFGTTLATFGSSGQVLCSQGPTLPPVWATVASSGGTTTAGVGSGLFNTSISCQVGYAVTDKLFETIGTTLVTSNPTTIVVGSTATVGVAAAMAATTGTRYIVHSIHVTNVAAYDAEITGRFDHTQLSLTNNTATTQGTLIDHTSFFASRLPVPSGSAVELIKKPQILNNNDWIRLQATSANGGGGVNGALYAYIVYEQSSDFSYNGSGINLASTSPTNVYSSQLSTGTTTATSFPSVIESVRVTNYSNVADYRITVSWTNSVGTVQSYLAYNMLIPAFSTVELLEKPKRLTSGDIIKAVPEASNVLSIQVSGKLITSTYV